jgi:pyruvate dehydrogenase E1 component alpha subunit
MADPAKYRSVAEHDMWKSRDPIPNFGRRLMEEGIADELRLDEIRQRCVLQVQESVAFAEESPWPEDKEIWEDIYV